jgi:hypothetical protein
MVKQDGLGRVRARKVLQGIEWIGILVSHPFAKELRMDGAPRLYFVVEKKTTTRATADPSTAPVAESATGFVSG